MKKMNMKMKVKNMFLRQKLMIHSPNYKLVPVKLGNISQKIPTLKKTKKQNVIFVALHIHALVVVQQIC